MSITRTNIERNGMLNRIKFGTHYSIQCIRDGEVIWTEETDNMIVQEGLQYILGSSIGDTEKKQLHCGLCTYYEVAHNDTMEHHAFVEFDGTSSLERPSANFEDSGADIFPGTGWTYTAVDIQFLIFRVDTLRGIFLTDNKFINSNSGFLFGVAPFSEDKPVSIGDSLLVTISVLAEG